MKSTEFELKRPVTPEVFWSRVEKDEATGCWIYPHHIFPDGSHFYGQVGINGKTYRAHRYAFFLTHGYWPEPMCLHSCDNPPCVNPDHLRAGTAKDNVRDAIERKRINIGEDHHGHRLTEELVIAMRLSPLPNKEWAALTGLDNSVIRAARVGKTWRHLPYAQSSRRMPEGSGRIVRTCAKCGRERIYYRCNADKFKPGTYRCRDCYEKYSVASMEKRKAEEELFYMTQG